MSLEIIGFGLLAILSSIFIVVEGKNRRKRLVGFVLSNIAIGLFIGVVLSDGTLPSLAVGMGIGFMIFVFGLSLRLVIGLE